MTVSVYNAKSSDNANLAFLISSVKLKLPNQMNDNPQQNLQIVQADFFPRIVEVLIQNENENGEADQQNEQLNQGTVVRTVQWCLIQADIMRMGGNFGKSLELYQGLEGLFGQDYQILMRKGTAYYKEQRFEQAVAAFQEATIASQIKIYTIRAQLMKANALCASGKFGKALSLYKLILPNCDSLNQNEIIEIHYQKGLCYMAQRQYKKAIFQFQLILRKRPSDSSIFFTRGVALFYMGQYKAAISSLNYAVIHGFKDNTDLLTLKGKAHYNLKEYEKAKISFQNAIYIDQESCAHLKLDLALIRAQQAKKEEQKIAIAQVSPKLEKRAMFDRRAKRRRDTVGVS